MWKGKWKTERKQTTKKQPFDVDVILRLQLQSNTHLETQRRSMSLFPFILWHCCCICRTVWLCANKTIEWKTRKCCSGGFDKWWRFPWHKCKNRNEGKTNKVPMCLTRRFPQRILRTMNTEHVNSNHLIISLRSNLNRRGEASFRREIKCGNLRSMKLRMATAQFYLSSSFGPSFETLASTIIIEFGSIYQFQRIENISALKSGIACPSALEYAPRRSRYLSKHCKCTAIRPRLRSFKSQILKKWSTSSSSIIHFVSKIEFRS